MPRPEHPFFGTQETTASTHEAPETEQEITWKQTRLAVEQIADRLGKGVDQGIKETVTAFLVYGFHTCGSCEGHLGEGHGLPHPWIDIEVPAPQEWKTNPEKKQEWALECLREQKKLIELLGEFYTGRDTPFDSRLTFRYIGAFGSFRLQSVGAEIMPLLSAEEQAAKLHLYRKEMNDFTTFLRDRYFRL